MKKYFLKDSVTDEPNITAVVPNCCGCRCKFCFDKQYGATMDIGRWLERLNRGLVKLSSSFPRVSISGGEPSLLSNKDFEELLRIVRNSGRQAFVTTNGQEIERHLAALMMAAGVNISYHGVTQEASNAVFGADVSPDIPKLKRLCINLAALGTPVRLQKVWAVPPTLGEVIEYAAFARDCGAVGAAFRLDVSVTGGLAGDWLPLPKEAAEYITGCPVCAEWGFVVGGLPIAFKAGVAETLTDIGPYELIFTKDGRWSTTWGRITPPVLEVSPYIKALQETMRTFKLTHDPTSSHYHSGCQGGSSACK